MPHTPGPWHYSGCGEVYHRAEKRVICNTKYLDEGETIKAEIAGNWDADGRLIAVAPDLLEALRLLKSWVDNWSPEFTNDPEWPADRERIEKAIAAASHVSEGA